MKENTLLSSFAVDDTNRLAFEVAKHIGQEDCKVSFNPCWFNAPSGCGKTHLVSIIASESRKLGRKVEIISGEEYINRFLFMIRVCNMNEDHIGKTIILNWLDVDVLIIEELDHCLKGKPATSELVADAIIRLIKEYDTQVIITSKRVEIPFYRRFLEKDCWWMLLTEFSNPNLELRKRIASIKLKEAGLQWSENIVEKIGLHCLNGSQIQGIIEQLTLYKKLYSFEMISEKALQDALKVKGFTKENVSEADANPAPSLANET